MKFLRFTDIARSGLAINKRVFIRADLNVPLDDHGGISDDTRIRASLGGVRLALEKGAAPSGGSHEAAQGVRYPATTRAISRHLFE